MSTRNILFFVNVVTVLGLIVGLANNSVIAFLFGLSSLLDSYFASIVLPMMFMSLFVDFVGKNFLPVYSDVHNNSKVEASNFASTIINLVVLVSFLSLVILVLLSPYIFKLIVPGFESKKLESVVSMFMIVSPAIVLMGVNTFLEYIWQYNDKYVRVVIANVCLPVSLLVSMLTLHDQYMEYSLAIGYVSGQFIRFLVLYINIQHKHRFVWDLKNPYLHRVAKNTGVLVSTGIITRIKPVVVRYFSSMLDAGSISAYSLAEKLGSPIHQTSTIGVRMMLFSKSSKLFSQGRIDELGDLYTNVVVGVLFFIVPLTVWVGVSASDIITILFLRGDFNQHMHDQVFLSLLGLLPSVILMSVCPIMSNAFYVLNKIRVPALSGPAGTVIYVACIMMFVDSYGLFGIAFANSIVFLLTYILFAYFLGCFLPTFSTAQAFIKLAVYSLVSLAVFYTVNIIMGALLLSSILHIIIVFGVGMILYVSFFYVSRDRGLLYILNIVMKKD